MKNADYNQLQDYTWRGPAIGLLDLDAFFTSVEQLDHPDWRGKPVIVGGSADKRGVVSTASYEARVYGVHSAQPSAVAKRLCPNAIWTTGNMARYKEVSAQVMTIIASKTPRVEQVSIDEAFFDITPGTYSSESPIALCQEILDEVKTLGITASIGLATNKAIAKIASEAEKPQGFTVVPPGTEELFIQDLPVRALSGIGPAMERAFHTEGIYTLGQFLKAGASKAEVLFGKNGVTLYERIAGISGREVHLPQPEKPKSLSHDETFPHDLTNQKDIEEAIKSIATEVGRRMRRKGLKGHEVTLRLKYTISESHTAQAPLPCHTNNEYDFVPVALQLLKKLWVPGTPVRLVGVGLSKFDKGSAATTQLKLTEMAVSEDGQAAHTKQKKRNEFHKRTEPSRDRRPLAKATDSIKNRFGKSAIQYGRDLRFGKSTGLSQNKEARD